MIDESPKLSTESLFRLSLVGLSASDSNYLVSMAPDWGMNPGHGWALGRRNDQKGDGGAQRLGLLNQSESHLMSSSLPGTRSKLHLGLLPGDS